MLFPDSLVPIVDVVAHRPTVLCIELLATLELLCVLEAKWFDSMIRSTDCRIHNVPMAEVVNYVVVVAGDDDGVVELMVDQFVLNVHHCDGNKVDGPAVPSVRR